MTRFKEFLHRLFSPKSIQRITQLNSLGFNKITFPILIKEGNDLNLYTINEFASDPDSYFHEFDAQLTLIDSRGNLWDWKYDKTHKLNLPGNFIRTLSLEEVKIIVSQYFQNSRIRVEMDTLIQGAETISDLFESIKGKF